MKVLFVFLDVSSNLHSNLDDMLLWGYAIRFLERSCRYSADQLSDFSSWTHTLQWKPAKWDFCLDKCYFPGFVEETAVSNPRIFSLASEKRLSTLEVHFVNIHVPFYFIYIINRYFVMLILKKVPLLECWVGDTDRAESFWLFSKNCQPTSKNQLVFVLKPSINLQTQI